VVARSVLGVPPLRPSLLDNVSAAETGRGCCTGHRRDPVCATCRAGREADGRIGIVMSPVRLDDIDDDPDDDEGFYDDDADDEDDDDDDEEDEDDDVEPWQVVFV
jgi:hypothetical protein